jgi:hypothetical protein
MNKIKVPGIVWAILLAVISVVLTLNFENAPWLTYAVAGIGLLAKAVHVEGEYERAKDEIEQASQESTERGYLWTSRKMPSRADLWLWG